MSQEHWNSADIPALLYRRCETPKAFGIYYLANGLCVLAGTVLFGELYQNVSAQAAFWTGAGLAMLAAMAVLIVPRREAVAP